jgi:hypothetical protein
VTFTPIVNGPGVTGLDIEDTLNKVEATPNETSDPVCPPPCTTGTVGRDVSLQPIVAKSNEYVRSFFMVV